MEPVTKEDFAKKLIGLWEDCVKDLSEEDKIKAMRLLEDDAWNRMIIGDNFK